MNDYTEPPKNSNTGFLHHRFQEAEVLTRSFVSVNVKKYANDETRVTYQSVVAPIYKDCKKPILLPADEVGDGSLVYSDDLQPFFGIADQVAEVKRGLCLTRNGAHRLREAAAILERRYGKSVAFMTLTLPGSTRDSAIAFAKHSTAILNNFLQNLRRDKKHLIWLKFPEYCGVWEYQKRGALHLHLIIACPTRSHFEFLQERHHRWWIKVLKTFSKKTGVDLFAREEGGTWKDQPQYVRTEVELVRKSVGRYLAKYVSKDALNASPIAHAPPSRWWFMSDSLRVQVQGERRFTKIRFTDQDFAKKQMLVAARIMSQTARWAAIIKNPYTDEVLGYTFSHEDGEHNRTYVAATIACEKPNRGELTLMSYLSWIGPADSAGNSIALRNHKLISVSEAEKMELLHAGVALPLPNQEGGGGGWYHADCNKPHAHQLGNPYEAGGSCYPTESGLESRF